MTADRAAKQAVRDRAVRDGVPYSVARRAIADELTPAPAAALTPPHSATDVGPVLDALCGSDTTLEQARETIALGMVAPGGDGPIVGIADVRLAARNETRTVWSAVPVVSARLTESSSQQGLLLRDLAWPMVQQFGVPVLVDPRAEGYLGRVLIGDPDGMDLDPDAGFTPDLIERLETEEVWHERWDALAEDGVPRSPRPEIALERSVTVDLGRAKPAVVHHMPFVLPVGTDVDEFVTRSVEQRLGAAFKEGPTRFSSIRHFPDGVEGERHPLAIGYTWSDKRMPDGPQGLPAAAGELAAEIITGQLDVAFDAVGLARPQVVRVRHLGVSDDQHAWRIDLRLYGGVMPSDLAQHADRIATILDVERFQVRPHPDRRNRCYIDAGNGAAIDSDPTNAQQNG